MFKRELCWTQLSFINAEEALRTLARALLAQGLVTATFEEAVVRREAISPTGLPFVGRTIALPHTDPEHVLAPAAAVCTLATPLAFHEMGNPDRLIHVSLIAMLALPDHQRAQQELVRLIERCQVSSFLDDLYQISTAETLYQRLVQPEEA